MTENFTPAKAGGQRPRLSKEEYAEKMEKVFGKGSCYKLYIRPVGGTEVI